MPSLSFGRDRRLLTAAEFRRVFERPERYTNRFFTILVRPSALSVARLGLAVSRRHAPRAVDRNRIKRIVRETFRQHQERLNGLDAVVLARAETAAAQNPELRGSLDALWTRIAAISR